MAKALFVASLRTTTGDAARIMDPVLLAASLRDSDGAVATDTDLDRVNTRVLVTVGDTARTTVAPRLTAILRATVGETVLVTDRGASTAIADEAKAARFWYCGGRMVGRKVAPATSYPLRPTRVVGGSSGSPITMPGAPFVCNAW